MYFFFPFNGLFIAVFSLELKVSLPDGASSVPSVASNMPELHSDCLSLRRAAAPVLEGPRLERSEVNAMAVSSNILSRESLRNALLQEVFRNLAHKWLIVIVNIPSRGRGHYSRDAMSHVLKIEMTTVIETHLLLANKIADLLLYLPNSIAPHYLRAISY